MSKLKFTASVKVNEAQSCGRDRFYFAIGTKSNVAETEIKSIKEGASASFVIEDFEVDLSSDAAIFCTLIEVDMAKDGTLAKDQIKKLANQGMDIVKSKVDIKDGVIPKKWWGKLVNFVLKALYEVFMHLADDDLIGQEAIKLSNDFTEKQFTSNYRSPEGQRFLDYNYTVKYKFEKSA